MGPFAPSWTAQMRSGFEYQLVQLANGSFSVRSLAEAETFHPVIGPVAEAKALYVHQLDLPNRVAAHQGEFILWDVGLGAAANALTVLRCCHGLACPLRILSFDHTLEALRFALEHAKALGYFEGYETAVTDLLRDGSVRFRQGNQEIHWSFHGGDFPTLLRSPDAPLWPKPHAILFDAYPPAKNPEMWTQPLFQRIYQLLDAAHPCALPTYSRSTLLRVSLLLAGFYVGAGHATGEKEETTVASNSLSLLSEPLDRMWLARARRSTSAEPLWEPVYRQSPLSAPSWEKLQSHPQFQ